ncbi:MAG: hypothetical protein MUD01_13155, partial [Chloroflexaceae bacterium]|nr:hypothetical protein [Chloroflexaceae bacterium]
MRFISAIALLLVAVSLGALYSVQPAPMILALIPLLLGGGVAVVFFGGKQGAVLLAAIALSLSIAAASAIGMERWGSTGALMLPVVWLALLFLGVVWAWNSTIWVSGGTVVLIQHPGGARKHFGPMRTWPALPIFEYHYATIPLYRMIQHVHATDINTRSLWNLKGLEMEIHYRVRDPDKAFSGLPNRSRVFRATANEMNTPLHKALLMPVFWEHVLGARVREEAEDVLRQIVYQTFNYATEISLERARLAGEVQEHLAEAAQHWGVEIT